jgi:hypothetical protein
VKAKNAGSSGGGEEIRSEEVTIHAPKGLRINVFRFSFSILHFPDKRGGDPVFVGDASITMGVSRDRLQAPNY